MLLDYPHRPIVTSDALIIGCARGVALSQRAQCRKPVDTGAAPLERIAG